MSRKREIVEFMARLPHDQKRWIEEQADKNHTSQNAEVIRAIRFRMENEPEKAVG
jgi:hypothetical protein